MNVFAEPRGHVDVQNYWDSAYAPHRDDLLAAVGRLGPFDSVLELGCHCGPVRRRMRERFGDEFSYVGVDVNPELIAAAEAYAEDDVNAEFVVGEVPSILGALGIADVVISSSMLMFLDALTCRMALDGMRELARKAVVVQEPHSHVETWLDGRGWAHVYPDWVVLV